MEYISHIRESDKKEQTVSEHSRPCLKNKTCTKNRKMIK